MLRYVLLNVLTLSEAVPFITSFYRTVAVMETLTPALVLTLLFAGSSVPAHGAPGPLTPSALLSNSAAFSYN